MNSIFLEKLINQTNRITYCKITSFSIDNLPIEVITGQVTSGSVNLDGASAVRRTCQLTFVPDNQKDYRWALKTQFKLEIGISNFIDKNFSTINGSK